MTTVLDYARSDQGGTTTSDPAGGSSPPGGGGGDNGGGGIVPPVNGGGGGNGGGIPPYLPPDPIGGGPILGNFGAGAGAGGSPVDVTLEIGDVGGTLTGGATNVSGDTSTSTGGGLGDLFGEGTGKILLWGGLGVLVLVLVLKKRK